MSTTAIVTHARRSTVAILAVAAAVVVVAGVAPAWAADVAPPARLPDVLLISIDTLRPDVLGAYGDATARTPSIDALAKGGRLYTQATTPFPRTTPAVATLLTGLWPQHHGSRELSEPMHDVPTLAGRLTALGYAAIGVSSTAVLSQDQNIDRGFVSFVAERQPAGRITAMALERVAAVPAGTPAFLWVHYFDPHFPYVPWVEWPRQPPAESCRRLNNDFRRTRTLSYVELHGDTGGRASAARDDCRTLYAEEVAYTDHAIGTLLRGWAERRAADRTIVALTADHGEHFGEDGLWYDHGPSLHDAGLRIPLILAGPGVPAGTVDDAPARLEDIVPTVLTLLAVPADKHGMLDGRDLLAPRDRRPIAAFSESGTPFAPRFTAWLASGRSGGVHCINDDRWSLCRSPKNGERRLYDHDADPLFRENLLADHAETAARLEAAWNAWPPETARRRAIRTRNFKLVEYPTLAGSHRHALYDLRHDPAESRDRAADLPEIADRLQSLLDAWTADLPAPVMLTERDEEKLEILRSLGYVE